ncbi:thioesterase II family protein [Paenibacillus xerothermodurans]|uniref:Thioesterase n=1 Tax=Paenibacillus xerothermodurans TaxID=1977292 RepID=A0A2W1N9F9_PAEXE|nr:alpha/beta fold hydrolase [Paenibacillus xerothermodurans]PZE20564.1 thioesterase [Paenibacillus xerothermodurans]
MSRLIQQLGWSSTQNMSLICFPFAGGYSASFRPLQTCLQDRYHFLVAEPPGHGTNLMPLVDDMETLVELYLTALRPALVKPFVLFGHSMGGLVIYRLAQKLERQGIFPQALIISAVQPPHIHRNVVTHLDDSAFLDHVIGIGGIPPELVQYKELLDYFVPAFRADFKALETFKHTDHSLIHSPVHIFNGSEDEKCMADAPGWRQWFYSEPTFHVFQGGHMFLLSQTDAVAASIQSIIETQPVRDEHLYAGSV